jgi:hypothetical protein
MEVLWIIFTCYLDNKYGFENELQFNFKSVEEQRQFFEF